jgi:peptidoglycan/xylan/chitin deacetylase (PgdA/CDA1 family)
MDIAGRGAAPARNCAKLVMGAQKIGSQRKMRVPGIKTARRFLRWIQARILGGALILAYHRISTAQGVLQEVPVSPENFSEHLHELRKHTYPMSLSRLVQDLRHDSLPEKSIAVTFDDGYADNLYNAKPLLEKYEIPATVFICTGYMGKEFWWDELERLIACSQTDLDTLHLQIGSKEFKWHPRNTNHESGHAEFRKKFCRSLYHFLLALDPEDQNHAMDTIRSWTAAPPPESSSPRAMSSDEILQLVDSGLVEVGAHTSNHPVLPALSFERQREEIESSKRDLEALLGNRISGFAYPNGKASEYTKRIVQELGFAYGCTSLHNVVRPGNDIYELTRFWQKDVDGDRFGKELNWWMRPGVHR